MKKTQKQISVKIPEDTYKTLIKIKESTGISIKRLISDAINKYVQK